MKTAKLASDTEGVHQCRVASRRLRTAFNLGEDYLPEKQLKKWNREITQLTSELGLARDKDVQIEQLKHFSGLTSDDRCQEGVNQLKLRLIQRREKLQKRVDNVIDHIVDSGYMQDMKRWTRKTIKARRVDQYVFDSKKEFKLVQSLVADKVNRVRKLAESLKDESRVSEHHKMRIATKHLRYGLELFNPLFQQQLDPMIKKVKKFQTLLGDVHDSDNWVLIIDKFKVKELKRTETYFGSIHYFDRYKAGIQFLREHSIEKRKIDFCRSREFYEECEAGKIWQSLNDIIQSHHPKMVKS